MRRSLIVLAFSIGAASAVFGAPRSVSVTSGQASFTFPNAAPWTTIGQSTQPMRWELRLHGYGGDWPVYPGSLLNWGPFALMKYLSTSNSVQATNVLSNYFDKQYDGGPHLTGCCAFLTDIVVRVQRDVANNRYTFEVCDIGGAQCFSSSTAITAYQSNPSWAGAVVSLKTGSSIAFIRWFSSVVPVGTKIPVSGVAGDLGDWEFEGNTQDSSGHGLNFSGGPVGYQSTPVYAPVCNAGAQRTFRAGHEGDLDGSGSYALDGGSFLSYKWQLTSGPSAPVWSSHSVAAPHVKGLVFGSYVFQLTVADSSNQSSRCSVKDGAVATDDNNVVITNNTAIDELLGPMMRYGTNPWPWFDNRHKQAADNQLSVMDAYFPAWWDTPGPGTIAATQGSATIVGTGTTFTTTFCQGPSNPTARKSNAVIAIWHPYGSSGTGRVMYSVTACTDDTHLTMDYPYAVNETSSIPGGSGLTYAEDNRYATVWGWSMAGSPGNYYDNVAAYYALYYRSGIDDYLTAARALADRFWKSPMIDQGLQPSGYGFGGRSTSALGLVLRALDGRPDMWTPPAGASSGGLHRMWNTWMGYLNGNDPAWGLWDTREEAYHLAMVSYCALFDPDASYQSACKSSIISSFPKLWTPTKFADGSWPVLFGALSSWSSTPATSVTLTKGSTAVTGVGTTWSASSFGAGTRIWFTNTSSVEPANNSGGDVVSYGATWVSPTQLTLSAPYAGASGTHGWQVSAGITGWGTQPFMEGILAVAFDFAAKAVADVDPATAALAHSYNVAAAGWLRDYAYWPATKGVYYFAGGIECQPPISDGNTLCTAGNSPGQARTLASEVVRGVDLAYAYNQDASLKAFGDTLYNAMWAKPLTCPSGPTVCAPDGSYLDPMDDGQYMIATPPLSSLGAATPWKWFGQFFGFSALSSWPGYRVGGALPKASEPVYINANLAGVPGATGIQVVTTDPNGVTSTTKCGVLPCAVIVDRRLGDPLMSVQYLSATGATLASSSMPLIGGQ